MWGTSWILAASLRDRSYLSSRSFLGMAGRFLAHLPLVSSAPAVGFTRYLTLAVAIEPAPAYSSRFRFSFARRHHSNSILNMPPPKSASEFIDFVNASPTRMFSRLASWQAVSHADT